MAIISLTGDCGALIYPTAKLCLPHTGVRRPARKEARLLLPAGCWLSVVRNSGKVWGVRNRDAEIWKLGFVSQLVTPKCKRLDGGGGGLVAVANSL